MKMLFDLQSGLRKHFTHLSFFFFYQFYFLSVTNNLKHLCTPHTNTEYWFYVQNYQSFEKMRKDKKKKKKIFFKRVQFHLISHEYTTHCFYIYFDTFISFRIVSPFILIFIFISYFVFILLLMVVVAVVSVGVVLFQ